MYKAIRRLSWILPILLMFGVVYAASLSLIYVEGDDVHMIAFQSAGHNRALLEHFVPYHSFLDMLLSLLPPTEPLLRMISVAATSLAAVILVILLMVLAFDWLGITELRFKWLASAVVLLTIPEFFYLGMVYLPSVIAMTGVVAAHVVLRHGLRAKADALLDYWKRPSLYIALLLFGVGTACRWDIGVYGIVIAADVFIGATSGERLTIEPLRRRFFLTLSWGLAAVVTALVVIWLTGYNPIQAFRELTTVVDLNLNFGPHAPEYPALIIGAAQGGSFLTPSTLLLIVVGVLALRKEHRALGIASIVSVALVLLITPWWASGAAPKNILPIFPAVLLCTVAGLHVLWQGFRQQWLTTALRAAVVVAIVGIWFIGIQIANSTAWGPGFQLRAYDSPGTASIRPKPVLGAGLEVFTSEGPRPVYGHAYVLLGGGWREVTTDWYEEQYLVVKTAMTLGIPELRIGPSFPNMGPYQATGYQLVTSQSYFDRAFVVYNFANATQQAKSVNLYHDYDLTHEQIDAIRQATGSDKVVVYGSSSKLRKLYNACPEMLQKVGKMSAVFDTTCLYKVFEAK